MADLIKNDKMIMLRYRLSVLLEEMKETAAKQKAASDNLKQGIDEMRSGIKNINLGINRFKTE